VELTSVRRTAGRDFITVTNTFTDAAGERVHTLHTTVVGVTAEDIDAEVKVAVQKAMMHDMNILDIGGSDAEYIKETRPADEVRSPRAAAPVRRGRCRSTASALVTSSASITPGCRGATW
jgi:hypothetical protein